MSTLIGLNICLSKLDKSKIITGAKDGQKHINLTLSINDKPDQFGKECSIWNEQTKQQRDMKEPRAFVGSGKILYSHAPDATSVTDAAAKGSINDLGF